MLGILVALVLVLAYGLAGRMDCEDRYAHQTPEEHAYLVSIGEVAE